MNDFHRPVIALIELARVEQLLADAQVLSGHGHQLGRRFGSAASSDMAWIRTVAQGGYGSRSFAASKRCCRTCRPQVPGVGRQETEYPKSVRLHLASSTALPSRPVRQAPALTRANWSSTIAAASHQASSRAR